MHTSSFFHKVDFCRGMKYNRYIVSIKTRLQKLEQYIAELKKQQALSSSLDSVLHIVGR